MNLRVRKFRKVHTLLGRINKAIEILSPLCAQVKTVVELDGKKRTFNVGQPDANSLCEIEAPENLELADGNPKYNAMKIWCDEIAKEFSGTMYPGLEVWQ